MPEMLRRRQSLQVDRFGFVKRPRSIVFIVTVRLVRYNRNMRKNRIEQVGNDVKWLVGNAKDLQPTTHYLLSTSKIRSNADEDL